MTNSPNSNNAVSRSVLPVPLSRIRSRDHVISQFVPHCLGLLWERGRANSQIVDATVIVDGNLEIGGYTVGPHRYGIHAYILDSPYDATKVFSAHVSRYLDPNYFRKLYWGGTCAVLSWRRGEWEDRIISNRAEPRSLFQLEHLGFTPALFWTKSHH
jgi:hypothetical protein